MGCTHTDCYMFPGCNIKDVVENCAIHLGIEEEKEGESEPVASIGELTLDFVASKGEKS